MLDGTWVSVEIFFLTLIFSVPLAVVFCAARMSKFFPLQKAAQFFLLLIRGTPLMLQLICVYFIPGLLFKWTFDRFVAAIIALSVNYAAYFAEIYRGGFESVPQGQREAAKVLGYSKAQTFVFIIIPQVVKRIIPAMGNEVITLVKDTALVQVIGVVELLHVAQSASNRVFSTVPLFVAGAFYFIMNGIVSWAFASLEKKLSYYK
ncbi:MAG: amino acid ABC transporter permease [Treponema sp.]|nr:amino acid ABC transporter permease [Treponema sp.]